VTVTLELPWAGFYLEEEAFILVEFPGLVGQVLFFTRNIKSHPKVS